MAHKQMFETFLALLFPPGDKNKIANFQEVVPPLDCNAMGKFHYGTGIAHT
jgi:hypothetical protein